MLRFSKKVEYALIAMVEMSNNHSTDDLVTAKALSKQYRIPPEILGKVLQTLVRKGLLVSVQGVKGGYMLAAPVDQVDVLKVVEAVDGPISLISCSSGRLCDCEQFVPCNIKTPMAFIQSDLSSFFSNITLKDLQDRYRKAFSILDFHPEGDVMT